MGKHITITDVARHAGVSKGTVDRVVHHRGEVSKETAEKVRKAIEELNYEPNLHATLLGNRTQRTIACLLPSSSKGDYWAKINDGIEIGIKSVSEMNLSIEVFYFDLFDLESFNLAAQNLLQSSPAGAVIAPLFKNESISLTEALDKKRIPYICIDTRIEQSNALAYIGMPKFRSGYLCASLLSFKCRKEEMDNVALIRVQEDKEGVSDPTKSRREGFISYLHENFQECNVLNVFISPESSQKTLSSLNEFFSAHKGIRYIVMLNSRIHLIEDFLKEYKQDGLRVIGFDNLEKNLAMLKNGLVDIIIAQDIKSIGQKSISMMADYLVLGKEPVEKDNFMHMDILTSINVD